MARIDWSELYRWSLVDVEFGTPIRDAEDFYDCEDFFREHRHGVNMPHDFSYRHMAIVVSKNVKDSQITVIPLTEARPGDKENPHRVFLEHHRYKGLRLYKDTVILTDHPITIDKKGRVKKIILRWIPTPLRYRIWEAMKKNFEYEKR